MIESHSPLSFLFLGANTPWVYALAEALACCGHKAKAIATYDTGNFKRLRPRWPERPKPDGLGREFWVFPPGYVGSLAPLFAPLLRSRLARAGAAAGTSDATWIIAPFPWFAHALRRVPPNRLIYYNLDDYVLYNPKRSETILRQEGELVHRAELTLCLSQRQVDTLRARFPNRARCIHHFPLGVVEHLINANPGRPVDGRVVGYIGNLIDRVDWRLVAEVARRMPDVEFHFIGAIESGAASANWERERSAALALPNVRHIGPVSQDEVGRFYSKFSVNWMPYAASHPFNQASCPTKIMDCLASGRPLISTDVPECSLYPEWIRIATSTAETVLHLRSLLDAAPSAAPGEISRRQVEFVRDHHTWKRRAELLNRWISHGVCGQIYG